MKGWQRRFGRRARWCVTLVWASIVGAGCTGGGSGLGSGLGTGADAGLDGDVLDDLLLDAEDERDGSTGDGTDDVVDMPELVVDVDYDSLTGEPIELTIESPDDGATVSGSVVLRAVEASGAELELDRVLILLDGAPIVDGVPPEVFDPDEPSGLDAALPFELILDTTLWSNGEHTVNVQVIAGDRLGTASLALTTANPDVVFDTVFADRPFYYVGETLALEVDLGGPIDRLDSELMVDLSTLEEAGFSFPNLTVIGRELPGQYYVDARIEADETAASGTYLARFTVLDIDGREAATEVPLRVLVEPEPLFEVGVKSGEGEDEVTQPGIYFGGDPPPGEGVETGLGSPPEVSICSDGPLTVTNGSCVEVCVEITEPDGVGTLTGLWLFFPGTSGTFFIPLEVPDAQAEQTTLEQTLELCIPQQFRDFLPPEFEYPAHRVPADAFSPGVLELEVQAQDADGNVSSGPDRAAPGVDDGELGGAAPEGGELEVDIEEVGFGDLQVSLVMDASSDLDLHVAAPDACELAYTNTSCNEGRLDLDSNPSCNIDGVNVENVFWPRGRAPRGEYTVWVNHWQNCPGGSVAFTVRVTNCGEVETQRGTLSEANRNANGTCDDAANWCWPDPIVVEGCEYRVRGLLQYEDRLYNSSRFTGSTNRPIRFARVEVRRASDNELLGQGRTDRNGRYEIAFNDDSAGDESPRVYVNVLTQTDPGDGLHRFRLTEGHRAAGARDYTLSNNVWTQRFPLAPNAGVDEDSDDVIVIDGTARRNRANNRLGGAFNIFDVVIEATDYLRPHLPRTLPQLNGYWAPNNNFRTSSYSRASGQFYILSTPADTDEYDDPVIFHEWMHFAHHRASVNNSPGGRHWLSRRADPRLAFAEGVGNFFGADVRSIGYYIDSGRGGFSTLNLETPTQAVAAGTSDGTLTGNVGEVLVSALLLDLVDATAEPNDTLRSQQPGLYAAIFRWLPSASRSDRGGTHAGVDLVDFLDGWFCLKFGQEAAVRSLLGAAHRNYPYDFGHATLCPGP